MSILGNNTQATIGYAKQILSDIDDASMCERPAGLNHPAWLLTHLATTADYAAGLLGGKGICPSSWNEIGNPQKPLSTNRADYPSKDELIGTFEAAFKNASELYEKTSDAELSKPQKLGFYETELPTVGDMATFLIIAHTNLHLGQLSAWRRATGKAPLF
jgi:DinB superfamily